MVKSRVCSHNLHKLLGPVLGSCCGAPLGARNPLGPRTVMPTALCTQQTLQQSLKILPLLLKALCAQSPQAWDTSPLLAVTSSSARCVGMALSSPATIPWWEKTGQSLVCPVVQGWESSAAVPREVLAGEETPRKSGGMRQAAHPAGMEAEHLHSSPRLPHRGWQGRQAPQSSLQCPQNGDHCSVSSKWGSTKPCAP